MRSGCYGKHRVVRKWKPKRSICSWFIFGEEKKVFSIVTNLESYDWTDIELIILKVDISDWRYTEYGMCVYCPYLEPFWFSMKINLLLQKHMGSELLFVDQQGVNWFSPTCRNCFVDRNRWASSNCFHYFSTCCYKAFWTDTQKSCCAFLPFTARCGAVAHHLRWVFQRVGPNGAC